MEAHFFQRPVLRRRAVAEGHIFKVHRAVLHFRHRVFRGGNVRLLGEHLVAPLQGGAGHGQHHHNHGQHHQAAENLGGVGEHGGQAAGGQPQGFIVARLHNEVGAHPGDGQHTAVDTQLHNGIAQGHDAVGLGKVPADGGGNIGELVDFLLLADKGFDHPHAVDVFLHHIVKPVVFLKGPVEDFEHQRHQTHQRHHQQRQRHAEHQTEPGADGGGRNQRQNQHHGAADGHTNHHLEGHLQIGHIRGQPGDDGSTGKFVNVGKAEVLHPVEHIMAQIFGKAGAGLGGQKRRSHAKAQGRTGAQHQQQALPQHHIHIALFHTLVHQYLQNQRDGDFHGDLANHGDGA